MSKSTALPTAEKGADFQAIGLTKGGKNSKIHAIVDEAGRPWAFMFDPSPSICVWATSIVRNYIFKATVSDQITPIFCNNSAIRLIYSKGRQVRSITSDGKDDLIFETPQNLSGVTLTCAAKGDLITALDKNEQFLYVYTGTLSIYGLSINYYLDNSERISGRRPISSFNSSTFLLPDIPYLLGGDDILKGKKIIVSKYRPIGWIDQTPYTHDIQGNLAIILAGSEHDLSVLSGVKGAVVQAVARCSNENYVQLFGDDNRIHLYPFKDGHISTQEGPEEQRLLTSEQNCILLKREKRDVFVLSDGVLFKAYQLPKQNRFVNSSLLDGAASMSIDGCFILSRVGVQNSSEKLTVFRNPFKKCL